MPRKLVTLVSFAAAAALALTSCRSEETADAAAVADSHGSAMRPVPAGAAFEVTLAQTISSKDARVGDPWRGTVSQPIVADGRTIVPVGSEASGVVSGVRPAERGDRAMLDLSVRSVEVNGRRLSVQAGTEAVIAGSTRARNLGAIGAATAAGAIAGHAIGKSGKGTAIGAIVGGGIASGVVAKSDGYQVVLKSGTALDFTTTRMFAVAR